MNPPLLRMEQLEKNFSGREILKSLDLTLPGGEFLCLLGPSGCGKSTLLRILAGLETPDAGKIHWHGNPEFAFVFQDSELLPWRTALENVRLPLELRSSRKPLQTREQQNATALAALERVGLSPFAKTFPHQLSGGMKMRVSIARALGASPQVLFMDEPFSAVDEVTRFDLQQQLRRLCEEEKWTVVFVTHSSSEAVFLADRVLVMSSQGGRFLSEQHIPSSQPRDQHYRETPAYQGLITQLTEKLRKSFQ